MTVDWNSVDVTNLAMFLDSETGRKCRELALDQMPKKAEKTHEAAALRSERFMGFLSFWTWAETLTNLQPSAAREASPWYIEEAEKPGKSRNPG